MSQIKFINTDLASLLCSTTFIDLDEFNLNINTNSLQNTALPANLIWGFSAYILLLLLRASLHFFFRFLQNLCMERIYINKNRKEERN